MQFIKGAPTETEKRIMATIPEVEIDEVPGGLDKGHGAILGTQPKSQKQIPGFFKVASNNIGTNSSINVQSEESIGSGYKNTHKNENLNV